MLKLLAILVPSVLKNKEEEETNAEGRAEGVVHSEALRAEGVVQSITETDFETRLNSLRAELAKCVADNDTKKVEEIACEIVQLKLSN